MPAPDSPTVSGLPAEKLMAAALGNTPVSSPAFAWVPPAVEEVAPWFPDYEVQSLAGRGAMGAVYRAVQRKLERPVAIKLLPAELAAREGVTVRFEREARALAQLNHPGIVALHDFGRTEGGHLFIVMEYVDGTDLSRLLHAEGGALGVPQALEIVSQVCDALQYAHNHGFVHRDIKPGNVLVDREGRVKIADFGLAKFIGGDGVAPQAGLEGRATFTGLAVGTPDYTAPEQLKGGPVDHRADIYSLGVMFYEMLTGDLPRGAWTPPSQRTAAPVRLDEVVNRALQSEPDRRYQQASEVKAAVAGVPEKRARASIPGIAWLPLGMLTAGIVLLSLNRQSVIPGVLLIMLAAVVWLYQQPQRRWMTGAVIGGLALWPLLKNGSLDLPSSIPYITPNALLMLLVPWGTLAAFRRTRRFAWALVTAFATLFLAGGLTTLGLSNHPKPAVSSSAKTQAATPAAITKMQEACDIYDQALKVLNVNLATNKFLWEDEIKASERDAIRIEGTMREALALGMDSGHPLAVEARKKYDELMRLNKEWFKASAERNIRAAKSSALDAAIVKFGQSYGPGLDEAARIWRHRSDEDRYQLVHPYLDNAPASIDEYAPPGFFLLFPDILSRDPEVKFMPIPAGKPGERAVADLDESINQLADLQQAWEHARQNGVSRFWTLAEQESFENELKQAADAARLRMTAGFAPDDPKVKDARQRLSLLRETFAQMKLPDISKGNCVSKKFRTGGVPPAGLFPENEDFVPGLRVHRWKGQHSADGAIYCVESRAIDPPPPVHFVAAEERLESYPEFWPLEMPLNRPRLSAGSPQSNAELEWIGKTWPKECAADGPGLVVAETTVLVRGDDNPQSSWRYWSQSTGDKIPWAPGEPAAGAPGGHCRVVFKGGKCYTVFDTAPRPQLFGGNAPQAIVWGARALTYHRMPKILDAILSGKMEPGQMPDTPAWQKEIQSRYGDYTGQGSVAYWEEAAKEAPAWLSWRQEYEAILEMQAMNAGKNSGEGIPFHPWGADSRVLLTNFVCSRAVAEKIAASCGARLPVPESQEDANTLAKLLPYRRPCHSGLTAGARLNGMMRVKAVTLQGFEDVHPDYREVVPQGTAPVICGSGSSDKAVLRYDLTRALLVIEWPDSDKKIAVLRDKVKSVKPVIARQEGLVAEARKAAVEHARKYRIVDLSALPETGKAGTATQAASIEQKGEYEALKQKWEAAVLLLNNLKEAYGRTETELKELEDEAKKNAERRKAAAQKVP